MTEKTETEVYKTVDFTKDEYKTLLDFLIRGVDDLDYLVDEQPEVYDPEDHIEDVIKAGFDLITRLSSL